MKTADLHTLSCAFPLFFLTVLIVLKFVPWYGLGSAIVTWVLALGGYVGTAEVQTESALTVIKFSFGYLPAIASVILMVVCLFMDVEKYHNEVHKAIEK